ncbi:hypothetical protein PSYAE_20338 [Pseudomonas amygdali pv. aesculi str. 0893_23]|nr:hypothetical protein PSYAE_20338 [Pseudomonas amygdali pv. aesculi str. 0893_23]KPW09572.1 hypothetical protein ALO90_103195 [Pseudomonas amygdali pv. aesculi]
MAGMWVVCGEVGSLYEAFRERGVAAVGWNWPYMPSLASDVRS